MFDPEKVGCWIETSEYDDGEIVVVDADDYDQLLELYRAARLMLDLIT